MYWPGVAKGGLVGTCYGRVFAGGGRAWATQGFDDLWVWQ
jgi:hypothetical protein